MEPARADAPLQLVFNGECLAGYDPQAVRCAVASALKLDEKRTARLFSGQRVVLRREVDVAAAQRHIARFAQMGAVVRAEPSTPRPVPALPKKAPARRLRAEWRLPLLWAGLGVLCIVVGFMLEPEALGPEAPPPAAAPWATPDAPAVAAPPPAADDQTPQDMTAEALREYKARYLREPNHKAFAISSGGAHAWHAGAASENEARERAIAGCMAALRPSDDGCRVIDADGSLEE